MSSVRFVGLDVHKETVVAAVADAGSGPAEVLGSWPWDEARVLKELRKLGPLSSLKVCYEAGPTGYGLARSLMAAGVDCVVVAPGLVPQVAGSRIKTDRRDARKLAHFLRSGDLTAVWIPDEHTEVLRDLERARDDARLAERRIKQQLLKFLLRHGLRYPEGKETWTKTHWVWVRQQKFEYEAQQRVLADAIVTTEQATARIARLDADIAECLEGWALAPLVCVPQTSQQPVSSAPSPHRRREFRCGRDCRERARPFSPPVKPSLSILSIQPIAGERGQELAAAYFSDAHNSCDFRLSLSTTPDFPG